jgi:hypothetical protein
MRMKRSVDIAEAAVMAAAVPIAPPKSISMGVGQTSADGAVQRAPALDVAIILTASTRSDRWVSTKKAIR